MDSDQQDHPQFQPEAVEVDPAQFPGVVEIHRLLQERRDLMDELAAATDGLRAANDRLEQALEPTQLSLPSAGSTLGSDGSAIHPSRPEASAPTNQLASSPAKTVADRLPLNPASLLGLAGSGVALMVLGGLALLGIQGFKPEYRVETPRPLTIEEAALLDWARSPEGQQARELMRWNSALLDDRSCEREVERLGVTWELQGKSAHSGFCTLWVVPPEQRRGEAG